jgi:hypothetical protein
VTGEERKPRIDQFRIFLSNMASNSKSTPIKTKASLQEQVKKLRSPSTESLDDKSRTFFMQQFLEIVAKPENATISQNDLYATLDNHLITYISKNRENVIEGLKANAKNQLKRIINSIDTFDKTTTNKKQKLEKAAELIKNKLDDGIQLRNTGDKKTEIDQAKETMQEELPDKPTHIRQEDWFLRLQVKEHYELWQKRLQEEARNNHNNNSNNSNNNNSSENKDGLENNSNKQGKNEFMLQLRKNAEKYAQERKEQIEKVNKLLEHVTAVAGKLDQEVEERKQERIERSLERQVRIEFMNAQRKLYEKLMSENRV